MHADIVNILLAFLEGLALIVSPCILPILPIILSGSLTGSKKRPLGIIIGFILTFTLFTFFSRLLVQHTGIDLDIIRNFSYALLIVLAIIMLSTYLTEKFTYMMRRFTNIGSSLTIANDQQGGVISGIIFGCLVGVIWTPCAGPILAAVIVQTVIQQTTFASFITVLAFGIGAAVPMLIIALCGREIMAKVGFLKTHTTMIRKTLGLIIILAVIYMIYGMNISYAISKSTTQPQSEVVNEVNHPYLAPALDESGVWINSPPLTLSQLKGNVVLIDFWTYSCINCLRTLPYLKDWYAKYHKYGFEIIGVHTPEFEFEKNLNNVKDAVIKNDIHYPVMLDSNFITWRRYNNNYWPAHYLINKNGDVVYTHFGEGEYDVTENNIRYLLGIKDPSSANLPLDSSMSFFQTPETYLGYARADHFKSPETLSENKVARYSFPIELATDQWALQGAWNVGLEKIISAQAGAVIKIHFNAKKVYVVMGSENGFLYRLKFC